MRTIGLFLLFLAAQTWLRAELYSGFGVDSKTGRKVEVILEYSREQTPKVSVTSKEDRVALPIVGLGTLYLDGARSAGHRFYITRFGDRKEWSLLGFFIYPAGYVGFLRIDTWEKNMPFVLYDDLMAQGRTIVGSTAH
jgi:hypothetical protein